MQTKIRRSSISIMANIAEGFGRHGLKDAKQFYIIARGSVAETQSHLYVFKDAKFISEVEFNETYEQSVTVNKLLNGLISNIIKLMNT
ncbi:MAG: four helix bundle protein [Elusimicrobiota bacterium]